MQHLPQQRPRVAIDVLDLDHCHSLTRALRNVLSTDLAQVTYAQLIDGLPTMDTVYDMRGYMILEGFPLLAHEKLCEGAAERARLFCATFDPGALQFDSLVMQRYQGAALGSREFKMRLVELVAAAIHQIAILLFQSDDKVHSKEDIHAVVSWRKEPEWLLFTHRTRVLREYPDPEPTLFYHVKYLDHHQYPHGLADVAGYWAEDRIFGGVTCFDRGPSGIECNGIYFLSGRKLTTLRVWRLLNRQFNDLVEFLLSEQPCASPFPIMVTDENRNRHHSWDAMALHHIFRDPWERKLPPVRPEDRDVVTGD